MPKLSKEKARVTKPKEPARAWRNRIVGHGEEDADQLLANPRNWRIHPKNQQDALKGVLDSVGWVQQVIVNRTTGFVVDGHARVAMAISKGEKVPVVYVELTEAEEALILATLDPLSAMAGTDAELLKDLVATLSVEDSGLKALLEGISPPDLKGGLTDPDAAPVLPVHPASKLGDLWLLGPHRVLCGDSTASNAVSRVCGADEGLPVPFLMVTDPPYGVEYDPNWRNDAVQAGNGKGAPGGRAIGKVSNDDQADWGEAWRLFPGDVAYVWHAAIHATTVARSLVDSNFLIRSQIIWAKSHLAISRGHYHWQHEPCWYAVRKGQAGNWHGDRKQTTLWQIDKPHKSETGHSTQKPVECMLRPIQNHTVTGDAVYDPFLGSGTTIIAAEQTGRVCYGIDIDPKYVDVIVKRWQEFTGKTATLDGDGRSFDEITAERLDAVAA